MTNKHNPGSREAIDAGCTCPRMDNNNGKGYMGMSGVWVYNEDCQYHLELTTKVKQYIKNKNDEE